MRNIKPTHCSFVMCKKDRPTSALSDLMPLAGLTIVRQQHCVIVIPKDVTVRSECGTFAQAETRPRLTDATPSDVRYFIPGLGGLPRPYKTSLPLDKRPPETAFDWKEETFQSPSRTNGNRSESSPQFSYYLDFVHAFLHVYVSACVRACVYVCVSLLLRFNYQRRVVERGVKLLLFSSYRQRQNIHYICNKLVFISLGSLLSYCWQFYHSLNLTSFRTYVFITSIKVGLLKILVLRILVFSSRVKHLLTCNMFVLCYKKIL